MGKIANVYSKIREKASAKGRINKSEIAEIADCSLQTVDYQIKAGGDLPPRSEFDEFGYVTYESVEKYVPKSLRSTYFPTEVSKSLLGVQKTEENSEINQDMSICKPRFDPTLDAFVIPIVWCTREQIIEFTRSI